MCKVLNFFDVIFSMRYLIFNAMCSLVCEYYSGFIHSLTIALSVLTLTRKNSLGINYMLFCLLIRRQSTAIYLQQISHALGYNSIWLNTILE